MNFVERVEVGEGLTRMGEICQAIDDRATGIAGQLFDLRVATCPTDNDIDILSEDLAKVAGG